MAKHPLKNITKEQLTHVTGGKVGLVVPPTPKPILGGSQGNG